MILLWGLGTEHPFRVVYEELEQQRAPIFLLDQRDVETTEIEITVGAQIGGTIRQGDRLIDLDAITAAYVRPCDARLLPAVVRAGEGSPLWRHALGIADTLTMWMELTSALVVNRFSDMGPNGSKPYQLELIRRFGFNVPETLVTTEPEAVLAFWEQHGEIVYKSVSSIRSIVSRLRPEQRGRLADVVHCPTQFQQFIRGTNCRVHVVGAETYACEIFTDATDYRYPADGEVELRACQIPAVIEERCVMMAEAMNLPVAGIDLLLTPDGEWYCLEVNPSPAFAYFEAQTGLPISAAIARLLASGASARVAPPDAVAPELIETYVC